MRRGTLLALALLGGLGGCLTEDEAVAPDPPRAVDLTLDPPSVAIAPGETAFVTARAQNVAEEPVAYVAGGCRAAWAFQVLTPAGEPVATAPPDDGACAEPRRSERLAAGATLTERFAWNGTVWEDGAYRPAPNPAAYLLRVTLQYESPDGRARQAEATVDVAVR